MSQIHQIERILEDKSYEELDSWDKLSLKMAVKIYKYALLRAQA